MRAVKTFFVFHERPTWRMIWQEWDAAWSKMGHVSAYGFTRDNTWFFFDPTRVGTKMVITHHHDEIEAQMVHVFSTAQEIYATDYCGKLRFPCLLPMNCVTQCAHLIGIRAFTPNGFRRKLARINAEPVHEITERRSGGQESAPEGAPDGNPGAL